MAAKQAEGCAVSKLLLLSLLAAISTTALAATHATVEQVEQLLASVHNQPDAKVAKKLIGLELTERVSSARLSRWQVAFSGRHTREALLALADASAFLNLPSADVPSLAMPDPAARQQILSRTIDYVRTTIHKLPNFSARRSTTHFEESSTERLVAQGNLNNSPGFYSTSHSRTPMPSTSQSLRVVDKSAIVVTYRDGHEVAARAKYERNPGSPKMGLTTSGEFGPILSTVIGDALRSKIYWGHWEQGTTGPLAVLRYAVPQAESHYSVLVGFVGADDKPQLPPYHGEITVDPTNGTILRLTLVSELERSGETFAASILVEYGPVTIGNDTYVCPLRGVALSKVPQAGTDGIAGLEIIPSKTFLNDVSFTQYHVFRADARILPDYDPAP
jgi:hypothetical protein